MNKNIMVLYYSNENSLVGHGLTQQPSPHANLCPRPQPWHGPGKSAPKWAERSPIDICHLNTSNDQQQKH